MDRKEAVSPVIGVILMVAVTVVLAAIIAAFVFGMTESVQASKVTAVKYIENQTDPDQPMVCILGGEEPDTLTLRGSEGDADWDAPMVGQCNTMTLLGDMSSIVGVYGGQEQVLFLP